MRIGIYGAVGSWDFGDYAMLIHNIQDFWAIDENIEFEIYTPNKYITLQNVVDNLKDVDKIRKITVCDEPKVYLKTVEKLLDKFYEKLIGYRKISEKKYISAFIGDDSAIYNGFKESIESVDILVFNGGGYFQKSWKIDVLAFCYACKYAKSVGKKVYFLSNSFGPFDKYKSIIKEALGCADDIMIRDGHNYSANILKQFGIKKFRNGPDDLTFVNDVYECKSHFEEYVVIEIMSWIERASQGVEHILSCLSEIIAFFIEQGIEVTLACFDNTDICAIRYINLLYEKTKHKEMIHRITHIDNMYQIFGIYKQCKFSLSFKYHPMILAIGSNRPFVGVICDKDGYYDGKMRGACENMGIESNEHVIYLDEMNSDIIIEAYKRQKECVVSYEEVKNIYRDRRAEYLLEIVSGIRNGKK